MILRQLFDPESSTYTYLIADHETREAALIDPVRDMVERDLEQLAALGLKLVHTLETHVHADHVTGAWELKQKTGASCVIAAGAGATGADDVVEDDDVVLIGNVPLRVMATPGHTSTCLTYVVDRAGIAFTGDALLIRGCGRTDFQDGDARTLFRSVQKIFALGDHFELYPAHDYKGRMVTMVGEERRLNARLKDGVTEDEFATLMGTLKLALPKKIKESVPANLLMGNLAAPATTPHQGFVGGEGI